jgi:hypothetical protein
MAMSSSLKRGAGKLTVSVFLVLIGTVLFCAYKVLPFYYYYYELQNQMAAAIRTASVYNDAEIRKKLWTQIKWMQIPAKPEALKIERFDGRMRISLPYSEVFYITWQDKEYDIHTFDFIAQEEGKY